MIHIDRPTGQLVLELPEARLARCDDPGEVWLHCDWCQRFFQCKSLVGDDCPFRDCPHGNLMSGIFFWDDLREPDDDRWPASTAELSHGMRAPDMEAYYAARRDNRISTMLARFAASPQADALDGEPRYLRAFLKMMSDLCSDLTVASAARFDEELALELIDQLPVWSQTRDQTEAPRMLAELRALFRFAHDTGAIEDAGKWLDLLADEQRVLSVMTYTMEFDPRLQPAKPCKANRRLRPCPAPRPRRDGRRKKKRRARPKRKRR